MSVRLSLILSLLLCHTLGAVEPDHVTIHFIARVPASTTGPVYIAGSAESLGLWKPNHFPLKRADDNTYRASVSLKKGSRVEFKLTRGSWDIVEKNKKGEETSNRLLLADADKTIELTVASWSTPTPKAPRKSTATGDIRLHDDFPSKLLDNTRRIWVWLPPTYDTDKESRYPVLYMHDGQNVFNDATSFAGEWRADETAVELIKSKRIAPLIIIAIANNAQRLDEYTPTRRGHLYARFLLDELKPFIDKTYRTHPARDHTAVAGSSLGGNISLYLAHHHSDQIGKAAALSPALWFDDQRLLKSVSANPKPLTLTKLWIDVGTKEGSDPALYLRHARDLAKALHTAGLKPDDHFTFREYPNAPHTESAWSSRFDDILEFLFPP